MKKNHFQFFTISLMLLSFSIFCQNLEYNIHGNTISDFMKIEDSIGSERLPATSNHVSFRLIAQPIKYIRKEKHIPDLISYYFFLAQDSTMVYILHEWDVSNFNKNKTLDNKQSPKSQKALIEKFKELEKEINLIYGKGITEGGLADIKQANLKGGLDKRIVWKPNDSTVIEMYTTISNYYETKGMVTIKPTHRIRLYINKISRKEKKLPEISEKRIDSLNTESLIFLKLFKEEKYEEIKSNLSDLITDPVHNEQLKSLRDKFDMERNFELFSYEINMGENGAVFVTLEYKYVNDNKRPPSKLIQLTFDSYNKIVGIHEFIIQALITD